MKETGVNRKDTEENWDRMDERVKAKWGELTRAERNALTVKRRSLIAKGHGSPESFGDDADRAIAAPGQSEA